MLGGFAVLFCVGLFVQQQSLSDFRRIEAVYIDSRQVTACANQALIPVAFGEEDDLDTVLEAVVTSAAAETELVAEKWDGVGSPFPYPPLRSAHKAVDDALEGQHRLYQALVSDPAHSDDELKAFGKQYARAERRLNSARNALFVGDGKGWARRAVCKTPPPEVRGN